VGGKPPGTAPTSAAAFAPSGVDGARAECPDRAEAFAVVAVLVLAACSESRAEAR
jgi:hypothetical protein